MNEFTCVYQEYGTFEGKLVGGVYVTSFGLVC